MRKTLAVIGACFVLLLSYAGPSFAQSKTPDAVIELSGGSVAAGVGYTWGSGTLIYQGKRYPLKVSGVSLASVGAAEYTAAGSVYGLKSPRDIDGVFTAVAAGGTLGGGGDVSAMQNQNGVVIQMSATTEGLSLTLAAEGLKIALGD
jgi:hypothetical protein